MGNELLNFLPILGILPENWKIRNFANILDGGTRNGVYKTKEFHGCGVKIVNMGELFQYTRLGSVQMKRIELANKELEKFILKKGDLLFARRSLVAEGAGKCSIVCEVLEPTTFESSIIRARPKSEISDSFFLYYLFNSPYGKYALSSIRRQVAVSGITGTDLVSLKIPLPPLAEQRAIAQILGTLDDKIELNRQMNETLEGMARAIFKSWFVDFDPVRAKAEGRDTGLPDHISKLFPDSFQGSEIGPIPKGWRTESLYETAKFINGAAFKNIDFSKKRNGLPVIKIAELKNGITDQTKFSEKKLDDKYKINNGEILLSWSGSPGTSINTFIWTHGKALLNQHIFRVVPINIIYRYHLYYLLKYLNPVFIEIARDKQTIGLGHVTTKDLKTLAVCIPPIEVIIFFNNIAGLFYEKIYQNLFQTDNLKSIRDLLLPKLISGEIRLPLDLLEKNSERENR